MAFQLSVTKAVPKIICVGKNYLKHVKQMGGVEIPKQPVLFLKPWSSLSYNPSELRLSIAEEHHIDHEIELGVLIKAGGSKILKQDAHKHIEGYFIGIDFTDRDLQKEAKAAGLPWTLSKGQDNFCPVSPLVTENINPYDLEIELKVNGVVRQKDFTANMHFKIDEIISFTSSYISLNDGDLILTGTPSGVGSVKVGDQIEAFARLGNSVLTTLCFSVTK